MKVYEKIKQLLEEKGWKVKTLNKEIQALFEDNAVHYYTLLRNLHGKTNLQESTLFQIALALGKTPAELKKNTDDEEKFIRLEYNKKACLEIENNSLEFLTGRLTLLPGAKTENEQDPIEKGKFIKWLYGLRGEVTCVLTNAGVEKKYIIKKNETFFFISTEPHHFENKTSKKAVCILIQNPKYI